MEYEISLGPVGDYGGAFLPDFLALPGTVCN